MSSISVIVASYGKEKWQRLALKRAVPSLRDQDAELVVNHEPDGNVASCRNNAALAANGQWLCFLDADDELAPGYIAAMRDAIAFYNPHAHTLFTPKVQYVTGARRGTPRLLGVKDLRHANYLIIGTLIQRWFFLELDGFDDRRHGYEDWELWLKADKEGAAVVQVPDALYVAHADPRSRNRNATRAEKIMWHYQIGHDHYPDIYNEAWLEQHLGQLGRRSRL